MADDRELAMFLKERLGGTELSLSKGASTPLKNLNIEVVRAVEPKDADVLANVFIGGLVGHIAESRSLGIAGDSAIGSIGPRDVQTAARALALFVITAGPNRLSPATLQLLAGCDLWPTPDKRG